MGHDGWKEEARSGVKMSESTVVQPPVSEWKDLPWKMIQRRVWKLQKRIFRAAQQNDPRWLHPSGAADSIHRHGPSTEEPCDAKASCTVLKASGASP